jgi:hypothetical protein
VLSTDNKYLRWQLSNFQKIVEENVRVIHVAERKAEDLKHEVEYQQEYILSLEKSLKGWRSIQAKEAAAVKTHREEAERKALEEQETLRRRQSEIEIWETLARFHLGTPK